MGGDAYAAGMGCPFGKGQLACLRAKKATELIWSQSFVYNQSMRTLQLPVADGFELPVGTTLADRFRHLAVIPKPLLTGTNLDDMALFFLTTPYVLANLVNASDIGRSVDRFYPDASDAARRAITELFDPPRFGGDAAEALFTLAQDGYFTCPTRRVANAMAALGSPVYQYQFSLQIRQTFREALTNITESIGLPTPVALQQVLDKYFDREPFTKFGAIHGFNEVLFWNVDKPDHHFNATEQQFGHVLHDMWAAFASGHGPWQEYAMGENYIDLDAISNPLLQHLHSSECDLLSDFTFSWNPLTPNGQPFFDSIPLSV